MSNGGFDMARCAGGGSWPCGQSVLEKKNLVGERVLDEARHVTHFALNR